MRIAIVFYAHWYRNSRMLPPIQARVTGAMTLGMPVARFESHLYNYSPVWFIYSQFPQHSLALACRPDYKQLGILKHRFPEVPIIALTATATQDVINDVKKILRIERCVLFKSPFNRPNLNYSVVAKSERGEAVLKQIAALIQESYRGEAGIVYCFSKKECAAVAKYLNAAGVRAAEYHADLSPDLRQRTHNRWYQNQVHVVVATVAFGMVWVQLVLHEKNFSYVLPIVFCTNWA
jgi:hypothetical protein